MTGKKEEFTPIDGNRVSIYGCGITVSGDAHFGHAKQAINFDVIKRYLQYRGYDVTYVRNFTDVDDKIIANAVKENITPEQLAEKYIGIITKDLGRLGVAPADIEPKASECILEIIDFTQGLIDKGHAYKSDENGDVYFDVQSFPDYGKLSNRDIEETVDGTRKASTLEGKRDVRDFALWKEAKAGEPYWESPWGRGRPGWHIECSAMIKKHLGDTIDIHGGGLDLKFPHHENEIAQSEALTGKPLAKYWVHSGLVKANGVKMSKSLGNGLSLCDSLDEFDGEVIRLLVLQTSYRSDYNYIDGDFNQAEKQLYNIYKSLATLKLVPQSEVSQLASQIITDFEIAMDDDFNSAKAIANIFDIVSKSKNSSALGGVYSAIQKTYGKVLNLFAQDPQAFTDRIKAKHLTALNIDVNRVNELMQKRAELKVQKNWTGADEIKNQILAMGLIVNDTRDGSEFDIAFKC